jgi:hypothetical protein
MAMEIPSITLVGRFKADEIKAGLSTIRRDLGQAGREAKSFFGDVSRIGKEAGIASAAFGILGTVSLGALTALASVGPQTSLAFARFGQEATRLGLILDKTLGPALNTIADGIDTVVSTAEENDLGGLLSGGLLGLAGGVAGGGLLGKLNLPGGIGKLGALKGAGVLGGGILAASTITAEDDLTRILGGTGGLALAGGSLGGLQGAAIGGGLGLAIASMQSKDPWTKFLGTMGGGALAGTGVMPGWGTLIGGAAGAVAGGAGVLWDWFSQQNTPPSTSTQAPSSEGVVQPVDNLTIVARSVNIDSTGFNTRR